MPEENILNPDYLNLEVSTDKLDYAPGETAILTITGVTQGGSVTVEIADDPTDPGDDGDADVYDPFVVVDGGTGDLDGIKNGTIVTSWTVPLTDAINATLNLTATDWGGDGALGGTDDRTATTSFTDTANHYSLDFVAARPDTYDHATGGGQYGDGSNTFVVESLEGGDFVCGDFVTFFIKVERKNSSGSSGAETIDLNLNFLADATGAPGIGFDDIVFVGVNAGDSGNVGDNGSTATLISETPPTNPFTNSATDLLGTVRVTDLEKGETVIVRVDVRIGCDTDPNTTPTGNLQASITSGTVVSPATDTIPVGNQTVPLKNVDDVVLPGSITGIKLEDKDGDGTKDAEDTTPISGITINLYKDLNGDGVLQDDERDGVIDGDVQDSPFKTTTTAADGTWSFTNLDPGKYIVEEVLSGGYQSNDSTSFDVTLVSGQTYGTNDDTTFLNYLRASKSGYKLEDVDGDGDGDQGVAGWLITLYDSQGNALATTTTDSSGYYEFTNLHPGDYKVVEETQSGWASDYPTYIDFTLTSGENETGNNFINYRPASKSGYKLEDVDGDGDGDQGVAGWLITLYDSQGNALATTTTDSSGYYEFTNLHPGDYKVVEETQSGWASDYPTYIDFTLTSGENETGNNFINYRPGSIKIIKDTVPSPDGTNFEFDPSDNLQLSNFFLDDDGDPDLSDTKTFVNLRPGTYSVSELAALGFILTGITISGDDDAIAGDLATKTATIKLDPGENVEVTFKNTSKDHIRDLAPCIEVEKLVSVDGGAFFDADLPLGPIAHKGDSISYKYLVTAEDGPITNVVLVDDNGTASTADDFNPTATLVGGFNIGDANQNNILDVGETWEYTANGAFKLGLFTNIATATGDFSFKVDDVTFTGTATDTDPANVWGVNTKVPCYWRTCTGLKQWDGRGANDLLVDTDGNGSRDGLIIGDLNFNKVEDGSENTLIIGKYAALSALRATGSGEPQLKKELVAAWLNASMTNNGDHFNLYEDGDGVLETCEPGFWINQAVLWLAEVAPLPGTANASSTAWLTGVDLDGLNGITPDTESGQKIWANLFQYNKDGTLLDPCDDTSVDNPCTIAFDPPYDNLNV